MLNFVLIAAAVYLLYTIGVRFQLRAQLFGKEWQGAVSYICSMAAGMTAGLYVTLSMAELLFPNLGVYPISIVSTLISIAVGEMLHARTSKRSLLLVSPLRSKGQKR